MLDKVHRIQDAGMEVWSGMIVGFDNDDATVFESQRRFIEDSHIANTMVNILVAIPRTPLYTRMEKENRIDNSDEAIRRGSNVIPKQLSVAQLRDGCARLMRDLYTPAAYFDRLDKLYLERGLRQLTTRSRYLRRHPLRALSINAQLLVEALATIWQLMRRIPDAAVRREYRRRLWQAFKRRPEPAVLQVYALKCALHFHSFIMAKQMMADIDADEKERNEYHPVPQPAVG